jgi:hypothetical protein
MFGSTALETAFGLVFVFLLVSLACTAAKEVVELILKKRSVHLEAGLRRMLGAPEEGAPTLVVPQQQAIGAADATAVADANRVAGYKPPLKREMTDVEMAIAVSARTAARARMNPAEHVAAAQAAIGAAPEANKPTALMHAEVAQSVQALGQAAVQAIVGKDWLQKLYSHPLVRSMGETDSNDPSYLPSATFAKALMHLVRIEAGVVAAGNDPVADFRTAVQQIPNESVKGALLAMLDVAGTSIDRVQKEIEGWFDGAMERVSGWYKRWSQIWVFVFGIAFTIVLNVDAIAIGRALWSNPALRESVTIAAQKQVAAGSPSADSTVTATNATKEKGEAADPNADVIKAWDGLEKAQARVLQLGLPIGWNWDDPHSVPQSAGSLVFKLLGLSITILAVSLGAPFWFDVLNKIAVVRNAIKPQPEKPDTPASLAGPVGAPGHA